MTLNTEEQKAKWFIFAHEMLHLASALYSEVNLRESDCGASDPKVIAIALLCRTVSNFRGALAMINEKLIVEARTLTRSCVENLIFMDKLAKDGKSFVKEIVANEYKSREMRGQVLAQWASGQKTKPAFTQELHGYLKSIKSKPKALINVKDTAQAGVLKDSYLIYSQLSSDAAHPSADSLSRYTQRNSDRSLTIVADGITGDTETLQTLEFACSMLLGVCVGANEIIGGLPSGAKLELLFQRFITLRQSQSKAIKAPAEEREQAVTKERKVD